MRSHKFKRIIPIRYTFKSALKARLPILFRSGCASHRMMCPAVKTIFRAHTIGYLDVSSWHTFANPIFWLFCLFFA